MKNKEDKDGCVAGFLDADFNYIYLGDYISYKIKDENQIKYGRVTNISAKEDYDNVVKESQNNIQYFGCNICFLNDSEKLYHKKELIFGYKF